MPRNHLIIPMTKAEAENACVRRGRILTINRESNTAQVELLGSGTVVNAPFNYHCECREDYDFAGYAFHSSEEEEKNIIKYLHDLEGNMCYVLILPGHSPAIIGFADGLPRLCFSCPLINGSSTGGPGNVIVPNQSYVILEAIGGCPPFVFTTIRARVGPGDTWFEQEAVQIDDRVNTLYVDRPLMNRGRLSQQFVIMEKNFNEVECYLSVGCPDADGIKVEKLEHAIYNPSFVLSSTSGNHYWWKKESGSGWLYDPLYGPPTGASVFYYPGKGCWALGGVIGMYCTADIPANTGDFADYRLMSTASVEVGDTGAHIVYSTPHMDCGEKQTLYSSDGEVYGWKITIDNMTDTSEASQVTVEIPPCGSGCHNANCEASVDVEMFCEDPETGNRTIIDQVGFSYNCWGGSSSTDAYQEYCKEREWYIYRDECRIKSAYYVYNCKDIYMKKHFHWCGCEMRDGICGDTMEAVAHTCEAWFNSGYLSRSDCSYTCLDCAELCPKDNYDRRSPEDIEAGCCPEGLM